MRTSLSGPQLVTSPANTDTGTGTGTGNGTAPDNDEARPNMELGIEMAESNAEATTDEPTPVDVEVRDDGIAIVTMNRPDRLNALSTTMTSAITDAFRSLHRERTVRVIILRGAGRAFCSGADLVGDGPPAPDSAGRGPVGTIYRVQEHLADMIVAVHECDKPVIAAVHGAAVGGGLALALAADMRVCTNDAKFGVVFHNLGLSGCDVGVSYFLPRIVGPTHASELMLTGRIFSGDEADRYGMINRLVADGDTMGPSLELAAAVSRNSEYGVWMTKRGMWLGLESTSLRAAVELENRTQVLGTFTGNMGEGISAFLDRRQPEWKPL